MLVSRAWIVVAGLALTGCRDREAPAAKPDVSQGSGRAAIAAPEGPSLGSGAPIDAASEVPELATPPQGQGQPAATPPVPGASARDAFAAQTRDPSWAPGVEAEISKRLRTLNVSVDRVECRHDQCELSVGGVEDAVTDAIAKLEGKRGLGGYASSLLLTAPEQQGERIVVRAYATFDR